MNLTYTTRKAAAEPLQQGVQDFAGLAKIDFLRGKAIRLLYATGEFSYPDLAEVFGVGITTVGDIIRKDS